MEDEESKACPNCKRDIPSVNFLVHSMHCTRNIKVCPVCKEPVPQGDLQSHHETMHQMLPCKFCGESVCGTDLEDHIRDSCGHTIRPCRFCELELPRRELPIHEGYCGARTEHCAECGAWVMAKYRHIHVDSNHGFIKLDEEPDPTPRSELKATNLIRPQSLADVIRFRRPNTVANATSPNFPKTEIRHIRPANEPPRRIEATSSTDVVDAVAFTEPTPSNTDGPVNQSHSPSNNHFNHPWTMVEQPSSSTNWPVAESSKIAKRNNDQPQVNTNKNKNKEMTKSRGAVKKRTAPKPPKSPPSCVADLVYQSARNTREEGASSQNPRKMEAYRLTQSEDSNGHAGPSRNHIFPTTTFPDVPVLPKNEAKNQRMNGPRNLGHGFNGRRNVGSSGVRNLQRRNDFKDLKPMTHQEFMERFQELQLVGDAIAERRDVSAAAAAGAGGDRFSEIKSSLRELRRGLNEVTAPYNASSSTSNTQTSPLGEAAGGGDPVVLPCEFCGAAVPPGLLIDHQSVCRLPPDEEPLIPCEFCTEPLPLRRLAHHQERCQRETNLLFQE